jgi:hypothetical protein
MRVASGRGNTHGGGKKTAQTIQTEVAREVTMLLERIFAERHRGERTDLEAVETALRSAMHQAGAAALTELLQFAEPSADGRSIACACGERAHYVGLRSQPVLTAVGEARVSRPYSLCWHCHVGQFPVDVELDIQHTGLSPGVRRMLAAVGSAAPFDDGRQQMQLLLG